MCTTCGCGQTEEHEHVHEDGTAHRHAHGHDRHDHTHETARRTVTLEEKVLAANDAVAAENRARLTELGMTAMNLISSPGAGKTLLLEKTLAALKDRIPCAVITGDQQTHHDADRLRTTGVPVRQIETGSACHLSAAQIKDALPHVVTPGETRLLFIENVGNLVCPAAFDLGEHFKIALLSTTEGEDKPVKYPVIFSDARVTVLTKIDLAPHLDWDRDACRKYIRRVQPGAVIYELSAKTGEGMDAWLDYLSSLA